MRKTVRFYRPVLTDKNDIDQPVPAKFWPGAVKSIEKASAADRRIGITGSPWFGDAGTGSARAYRYIRSGRVRLTGENPSVVNDKGDITPLALAPGGALFETAYLVPFGTDQKIAMVGPLRGTASRVGIETWLTVILGLVPKGYSLKLEPLVDEALAQKMADAIGISKLVVTVPAGVTLSPPEGPQSQVEKALESAEANSQGELDVTLGWSYGHRQKGEKIADLLAAAKRLWQTDGIKRLEVSLLLPTDDGNGYRSETHELIEDKITVQSDFNVDDQVTPDVDDMLEGIHGAIEQYTKPKQPKK